MFDTQVGSELMRRSENEEGKDGRLIIGPRERQPPTCVATYAVTLATAKGWHARVRWPRPPVAPCFTRKLSFL